MKSVFPVFLSALSGLILAVVAPDCALASTVEVVYHRPDIKVTLTDAEKELADEIVAALPVPAKLDFGLVDAARRLTRNTAPARDALNNSGVSDEFVVPLRYRVIPGERLVAPILTLLNGDIGRMKVTHFGVGVLGSGGQRRLGVVFVRRGAALGRFPKVFHEGDRYLLNGNLMSDFKKPRILVSTPDGRVMEFKPKFRHGTFFRMLHFARGTGRYVIEIQARNKYGIQVLNLLEIYVGKAGEPVNVPVVRLRPEAKVVKSLTQAEQRLRQLVNHSRRRAGLKAVSVDTRLYNEARTHSADMAEVGFFGHISPKRGALRRRLRRAGMSGIYARENIAIAPSPEAAHTEWLRSPSHMRNMFDPHVTHLGIGVHQRNAGPQPVFTFTQIFAELR